MSIEKLTEHLSRYAVSETMGTGFSDRMAGMSPLEYKILGKDEQELALVQEIPQGGQWKLAMHNTYFRNGRALDLNVMDEQDKLIFSIEKPYHNPYMAGYRAVVKDSDNRPMGTIQKSFNPFFRTYQLRFKNTSSPLSIRAPVIRPWTFPIHNAKKRESAVITKRFPSAGEFMTYRQTLDVKCYLRIPEERCSILSVALLISNDYFFQRGSH